jgi:DNA polymerase-3 subunit alpha
MSFVHLHTHSEYSLLDGANRISDLVAHVKRLGMDSLAVTDHGNMHAAWSFYEEAKAQQIRPILGFEAYLAYGPRQAREKPAWAPAPYSHLVLLARNRVGYRNLVRLTSIADNQQRRACPHRRQARQALAAHDRADDAQVRHRSRRRHHRLSAAALCRPPLHPGGHWQVG